VTIRVLIEPLGSRQAIPSHRDERKKASSGESVGNWGAQR
jgi:hypothetical protein